MSAVTEVDATRDAIPDEMPCATCGYLLRGLDPAGRCPECNASISESRRRRALVSRRALAALKRGAIGLLVSVALYSEVAGVAFSPRMRSIGTLHINSDGTRYLLHAILLLPAAWLLGRADAGEDGSATVSVPRPQTRTALLRRLAVRVLPVILLVLAGLMFVLIFVPARHAIAVLLASYLLAPIVLAAEVILLLGVLARRVPPVPGGPRRWWVRAPRWLFGGVLLLEALAWVPVTGGRILAHCSLFTPPPHQYVSESVNRVIQPVFRMTILLRGPLLVMTVVALLCYAIVLYRSTRFLTGTIPSAGAPRPPG
jgi:hypothetical protein